MKTPRPVVFGVGICTFFWTPETGLSVDLRGYKGYWVAGNPAAVAAGTLVQAGSVKRVKCLRDLSVVCCFMLFYIRN